MAKSKYKDLLAHFYWGSFDSGVIFIFLSLMIWDETENMVTVALVFAIPIVIDTVIDYFFSTFSDGQKRKNLIIAGNIGSAVALSFYGFASSLYILYGLIFFLKEISRRVQELPLADFP